MYKVINIANNRDLGGAFFSSPSYHPRSHTLPFEPYIAGLQLKLDQEMTISDEYFATQKDYLLSLQDERIIKLVDLNLIKSLEGFSKTMKEFAELVQAATPLSEMIKSNEELVEIMEQAKNMTEIKVAEEFKEKFEQNITQVKEVAQVMKETMEGAPESIESKEELIIEKSKKKNKK